MRRFSVLLLFLAPALVAASLAVAGQSASAARIACGTKAIDVYFWPHGHPAMPAYGFPAFKPAHEEIYKRGVPSRSKFLAFISANEQIVAKGCKKIGGHITPRWGGGPIADVKTTRRIRCSFPSTVELRTTVVPDGQTLVVLLGRTAKSVVHTEFTARSSLAYYDKRYCTDGAVPGIR